LFKCRKCQRPLTKNEKYCTHCKSMYGNFVGKVGGVVLAIAPIIIKIVVSKGKK